ncbi:MAG: hypothetical protein EOP33_08590 [Rickettsiaceae bacterium]|nr:MAG: hypothetical protein EOP33_08590 [Rickettsiaceae bacterium]
MPRYPTNPLTNPLQYIDEVISLVSTGPDPLGLHFTPREAFSQLADAFSGIPTKPKADLFRYFWRNMPKRSYPSSFNNGGFAKKARYTKKYGGTGKKFADKYKHGGKSNIEAILYEAEARAKKTVLKTSETLESQSGWYMSTALPALTKVGSNLSGLNQDSAYVQSYPANRQISTNNVFVFPLSPLSQLGNAGTPGYRQGHRICAHSIEINIIHKQNLSNTTGYYHYAIVRNKSITLTGDAYAKPGITQTNNLALFKPLNQGPLATYGPNGDLPDGDWSSCMRRNTDDWSWVKSGYWVAPRLPIGGNGAKNSSPTSDIASNGTQIDFSKKIRVSHSFKNQVWEYSKPTEINGIKGGDYYFIIWREGTEDPILGYEAINGTIQFKYKDP